MNRIFTALKILCNSGQNFQSGKTGGFEFSPSHKASFSSMQKMKLHRPNTKQEKRESACTVIIASPHDFFLVALGAKKFFQSGA